MVSPSISESAQQPPDCSLLRTTFRYVLIGVFCPDAFIDIFTISELALHQKGVVWFAQSRPPVDNHPCKLSPVMRPNRVLGRLAFCGEPCSF